MNFDTKNLSVDSALHSSSKKLSLSVSFFPFFSPPFRSDEVDN